MVAEAAQPLVEAYSAPAAVQQVQQVASSDPACSARKPTDRRSRRHHCKSVEVAQAEPKRGLKKEKEGQSVLLERIYKALDADGDGSISYDEIAGCLALVDQSAGVGVASDDFRQFFDFLNADHDGCITKKEWDCGAQKWFEQNSSAPLSKYLQFVASCITSDRIGKQLKSLRDERHSTEDWDSVKSDSDESDWEEEGEAKKLIGSMKNSDGAVPVGQELYLTLTDQKLHCVVSGIDDMRAYPYALSLPGRGKKSYWCMIDLYKGRVLAPQLSRGKLPFTFYQATSVFPDAGSFLGILESSRKLSAHPDEIFGLISNALKIIQSDPCLIRIGEDVSGGVSVFGDIHGNFDAMKKLLEAVGAPSPTRRLLCLGDYVDRGKQSLKVILYLLALKVKYPRQIYLLRGNHEDGHINARYGFQKECHSLYPGPAGDAIYRNINNLFCYLPLAAVIDFAGVFCCHGGIGPSTQSLSAIAGLQSYLPCGVDMKNPGDQATMVKDLLWADPAREKSPSDGVDEDGFAENKNRGMSYHFGPKVTEQFLLANKLSMIVRGHEVAQKGFELFHDGRVVTLFSSPGYQKGNSGASFTFVPGSRGITVFVIDKNLCVSQTHSAEIQHQEKTIAKSTYFLICHKRRGGCGDVGL